MSAPYEIIAQPFVAWVASVGSSFPDIAVAPDSPWIKIGTSGDRNYEEAGVSVKQSQKIDEFRALGSMGPVKAFRTEEGLKIGFKLADLTLEQYQNALANNTVTTVAPGHLTGGYKKIGLSRGRNVPIFALLLRGSNSPYGDDWNMQYEVPVCYQSGEPDPVFVKGKPAALALEFTALEDPDAASDDERFGRLLTQNAEAGT